MKKLVTFLLIISSSFVFGEGKLTEGKLIFDITYPESDLDQKTLAMLPSESVIYFKGQLSRAEIKMPMGNTIAITDGNAGTTTTLMDMMGNKMAIKLTKEDIEKEKAKLGNEKPEIKITDETRSIAGYTCKKAIITIKKADEKPIIMNIWFTKEISAPNSMHSGAINYEGLDGFMMEFETKLNSLTMKMTCRSAEQTSVEDSVFIIPDGYKITTMEELKNSMGGH
jgi:GLPGLI family protein